jgi:hypothetical protein
MFAVVLVVFAVFVLATCLERAREVGKRADQ